MTTFDAGINEALAAPLDRAHIKKRAQAGRSLSYIEGWRAVDEANRIFGFDGWSRETIDIRLVSERERKIGASQKDGWSVSYTAKVRVTVHGVIVREGIGAGHGIDVDLGLAHESAIKEAETDATKRSLMTFGNPFGLALYDKEQSNVADYPLDHDDAPLVSDILMAADKSLTAAAMKGGKALKEAWIALSPATRNLFGERCPDRLKALASDHDKEAAA